MSSRHLIDPDLAPMVAHDFLPGLSKDNLAEARGFLSNMIASMAAPTSALRSEVQVPGLKGQPDVRVLVHSPSAVSPPRPAILMLHGGGMVLGNAEMGEGFAGALALQHNAVVISVDYRLAPEAPFPAAIDDSYAALVWLHRNAATLGVDASRIVLLGQSAGGGLAASLAQMARDQDGPQALAQILVYPMLDHRTGGPEDPNPNPVTGEFAWKRAHNRFGWESLRGNYVPNDARAGHFSAALGSDLSKLPPAFIVIGALDLFFEESVDYARRLGRAGVSVELHAFPGAVHGFDSMKDAWMSKAFVQLLDAALTRAFARAVSLSLRSGERAG